jgi:hypothetical protein
MGAKEDFARHQVAQRRMQSGVKAEQDCYGPEPAKHLRVGINTALVDLAALARLLVRKGVITEAEYAAALAESMEEEVRRYEAHLSVKLGLGSVKLDPAGEVAGA